MTTSMAFTVSMVSPGAACGATRGDGGARAHVARSAGFAVLAAASPAPRRARSASRTVNTVPTTA